MSAHSPRFYVLIAALMLFHGTAAYADVSEGDATLFTPQLSDGEDDQLAADDFNEVEASQEQLPAEFDVDANDFALVGNDETVSEAEPDTSESDALDAADLSLAAPAHSDKRTVSVKLFRIKGWPEFKVGTQKQCTKVFGKRVCVNVPQAFERRCELVAYATISHPSASKLKKDIETCAREAVAAGVLVGLYTGNPSAGEAALKAYLLTCLKAKGVESLNRLSVKVKLDSKCGDWKPR